MEVSYKGEKRGVHDGGGLCSPGRWAPKHRIFPTGDRAKLGAEVRGLFVQWLKLFWKVAAGKMDRSPFEQEMKSIRGRLGAYLVSQGKSPSRRRFDVECEIQFRRLQSMLELVEDEDSAFLSKVVEEGVRLGVDTEMPRTPRVFEEKTRWTVDSTEEEMQEILAGNYSSAEDNSEDIRRQVEEELKLGTIKKMTLKEAQDKYGSRLAVAALGAVPKEVGSSRVRVIYDGTYSVDVNRRIRVRDRLRFPLVDDASAVLAAVEEQVEKEETSKVRLSVVYDVARAHKLIPVHPDDWGSQAFRMPGGAEDEIYVHTRGTFGIASAAYWRGRCAATLVRLGHRLAGEHLALWHLLYADDGWLTATGSQFWKKLLFWLFVLDLLEVPLSWKKVTGGVQVQWIGYHLDVHKYERGISEKKQAWVLDWIDRRLAEGGVVRRELKSVLGRLSFVAGALKHVRPFLSPIFSWNSQMASGTYAQFPDAVTVLLQFIREEVKRKPVRRALKPQEDVIEGFRVDAKAAQDDIVIGGWESFGGVSTEKSRWFSVRLNRKNAPWAYLRGDPFRAIASLELMGVLIALLAFGDNPSWSGGRRSITLTGITDNAGNSHVLRRYGTSKYPLSIIVMEVACQLDRLQLDLELGWVPRAQNTEADDLTNERFTDFNEANRVHLDFERLPFMIMGELMKKAGELDAELRLHKTSKEAKKAAMEGEAKEAPTKKRKKGEMRWKDPW